MKFEFIIRDEIINSEYNNNIKLIDIKKDLLEKYYNTDNEVKYLDFIFENDKPIKHFGKLYLEPGIIPTTMDKYPLNRFSIDNVDTLKIRIEINNSINLIAMYDNIKNNKINIRIPSIQTQKEEKEEKGNFVFKEEEFPAL